MVAQRRQPPGAGWSVFSCCLSSNRSSTLEAARGVSLAVKTARPQGGKGKEGHWESKEQLLSGYKTLKGVTISHQREYPRLPSTRMELARKHPSPRGLETKNEEDEEGIPQGWGRRDVGPAGIANKENISTES